MNDRELQRITRRHFFGSAGFGIGSLALASTMNDRLFAADALSGGFHHAPKAKSIIFLFMAGAPSQLDLFDYKPKLNQYDGQPCPEELIKGERFAFIKGVPKLLGSPHVFGKHGQSGAELSNLLPHLGTVADDIAIVKSMHTTQFNHAPAQILMNTGHQTPGRPSMGSWLTYGIGSESQGSPGLRGPALRTECSRWRQELLGKRFSAVDLSGRRIPPFGRSGLFLSNPDGMSSDMRRRSLDLLKTLNTAHQADAGDPEIESRIRSYEMAYKMQFSVPELVEYRERARRSAQNVRHAAGKELICE